MMKVDFRIQHEFPFILVFFDSIICVSQGSMLLILPKVDFMPGDRYSKQKQCCNFHLFGLMKCNYSFGATKISYQSLNLPL